MIKPEMLQRGDKIAIVSLSWGGLGDEKLIHKYYIAKERLENEFGLEVVAMPNALKGSQFVYEHGDEVCPAKWKPGEETLKPSLDLVGLI